MSLLQNSNAISTGGGYNLESSLRLRESASAYLNRTPSSTGNQKTFTISVWLKRGKLGGSQDQIISAYTDNNNRDSFGFGSEYLEVFNVVGGGVATQLTTTDFFRDPSSWYHVIFSVDTTQATESNRFKIYVNNRQVTSFSTANYPSQNENFTINKNVAHYIGCYGYSTLGGFYDGYMTEFNLVDGQALTPSDFGETDTTTGVWKPKEYTGTYGTNGFYLPMNGSKEAYTADYLVIAGGGGGGASYGGGGGAGGYQTSTATLAISTTYTITVGGGGAGSTSSALRGTQGSNSVLSGTGITTITSTGGGGGGSANDSSGQIIGGNGGSGGGGAANATGGTVTTAGGTGTSGQGNNGGSGSTDSLTYRGAGGGGGASAVGANGNSSSGGNGGAGTASSITGSSVTYAGGGGGGAAAISAGTGGTGGGGAGTNSGSGTAGTVNTGGGGGGAAANNGGSGGSGIVILRMPTANYSGTTTGSPTVTTDGTDTILQFNSSGSYTA